MCLRFSGFPVFLVPGNMYLPTGFWNDKIINKFFGVPLNICILYGKLFDRCKLFDEELGSKTGWEIKIFRGYIFKFRMLDPSLSQKEKLFDQNYSFFFGNNHSENNMLTTMIGV